MAIGTHMACNILYVKPEHFAAVSYDRFVNQHCLPPYVHTILFLIWNTGFYDGTYSPVNQAPRGANPEQIAIETGPVQFFAQLYAEYHTQSLVCSVGWNHVKFQHIISIHSSNPLRSPNFLYVV